jgi:hypothetical protein
MGAECATGHSDLGQRRLEPDYPDHHADHQSAVAGAGNPERLWAGRYQPNILSFAGGLWQLIWGAGPTFTLPTATDSMLGSGKWSSGPAGVVLTMQGHWVVGVLANQQWSFAGWGDNDVSAMLIQPFVNYNLPHGWYLTTAPIITANWKADSDNRWTLPLGAGVGKIVKLGRLPINVQLSAYNNVVTPEAFGADWQLRFQVQFLFPK